MEKSRTQLLLVGIGLLPVNKAYELSNAGDTVLLSPACKSFDMFDSFEHRGKEFKRIVNLLK
jgi:UDP-N-acetylmuramoylalanine--D-glutamate ligase